MEGALAEEEALCLHGEGGEELLLELVDGEGEHLGNLLTSVAFFLCEEVVGSLDDGVDLVFEGVLQAAFFAHEFFLEVAQAVAKGADVFFQDDAVVLREGDGGKGALCHPEVVVLGGCYCLVGGDEALGHQEGEFDVWFGDGNMLDAELGEESGVKEVSPAGEDRSGLVHATWVRTGLLREQSKDLPSRVHANGTLRHNRHVLQVLLRDIMAIGLDHSKCTGADQSGAARNTSTWGHIAVHHSFDADWNVGVFVDSSLAQEL